MATCEDCKLEDRVKALEADSERNQGTHKDFFSRFEAVREERARTDERYMSIMTTLAKLETDIKEMKARPGKRWETIVTALITGIVGFVVALLLKGGV